ncbi:MAG: HpcH/HpaI aldolase/citrate lyase family protein [Limnohabitans sp.]|jgi:citrate lyase subunit beta/citryl-CoA lyase
MQINQFRSLLFVPATSEHLWEKASQRGADAVVIDLEDAIPLDKKELARAMAPSAIHLLKNKGVDVVLRVNSDPTLWQLDLVDMPLQSLSAIMLPKVETKEQVEVFSKALAKLSSESPPPIAALLETPLGVLATAQIAGHPSLCALGFGAEDYSGAIGVHPNALALTWPAQQVITGAHAYGLQCWGMAGSIAEVKDLDAFGKDVSFARSIGFTGSVCIHPNQVAIVNRGFSPSDAELEWAQKVIDADQAARAKGLGAVLLEGKMIDKPIVDRARRWLAARTA